MAAQENQTVEKTIGVALFGAGIFAKTALLPAILAPSSPFKLLAVYSRSHASASSLISSLPTSYPHPAYTTMISLPPPLSPLPSQTSLREKTHFSLPRSYAFTHCNPPSIWMVAENYRFESLLRRASSLVKHIGNIVTFATTWHVGVAKDVSYHATEWRKIPDYQGGFLLDGGVHVVAALRLILADRVSHVSALTHLSQPHLPPVDTLSATLRTIKGSTGTLNMTYGSSIQKEMRLLVVGEEGFVDVSRRGRVGGGWEWVVRFESKEGKGEEVGGVDGVENEVVAFGEAIAKGNVDERGAPEEAFRDLALLEAMLKSNGNMVEVEMF
ncbi:hypothetical protein BC829DRAFT_458608 [Chytridium lagenaria]|nr:hypothetical protein BC829DRAFT_458608 [Chytridium lagenaria]